MLMDSEQHMSKAMFSSTFVLRFALPAGARVVRDALLERLSAAAHPDSGRRTIFALLVLTSAAMMAGHILAADKGTLGSNDRSRWCTIRALVDNGTYEIGRRDYTGEGMYRDSGITTENGWGTIDKFLHPGTHAFYSGKPPLFPTAVASVYWLLKHTLGWSITKDFWPVVRCTLFAVNWLPLTIYCVLLGRLLRQFVQTEWGQLLLMVAGCFGTYLTSFAAVLNNHTVAACCVLFAVYASFAARGTSQGAQRLWLRVAAAGFFAACAAAADLPAAAFLAWLGVVLLRRLPRLTLCFFVPAAALPVAAFVLTNYLAIGQIRPAYSEFGGPWYTYEGSYWRADAHQGIDGAGEVETKFEYAFNLLVGHHGLFSLTPVFLLGLLALPDTWPEWRRAVASAPMVPGIPLACGATRRDDLRTIIRGIWLVAAVVVGFYVVKTSNYGGISAGPRWLFWLTPLLLLSAAPTADDWGRCRATRWLGYGFLAVSIFSAQYSVGHPWNHPWLYQFMHWRGWLPY